MIMYRPLLKLLVFLFYTTYWTKWVVIDREGPVIVLNYLYAPFITPLNADLLVARSTKI